MTSVSALNSVNSAAAATGWGSAHMVCELAARLLFLNARWLKAVPAYTALPAADQLALLRLNWRDLFLLSAVQLQLPVSAAALLRAAGARDPCDSGVEGEGSEDPGESAAAAERRIAAEAQMLEELLAKFRALELDATEFACLKGVALFRPPPASPASSSSGCGSPQPPPVALQEAGQVAQLHEQAQLALSQHIESAYPDRVFRFGKLLLCLVPALRSVSVDTIQTLFFKASVGSMPIENLVVDMFQSADMMRL